MPVMGGARLCLQPMSGGTASGKIDSIVDTYRIRGTCFDAFYLVVNAGGGAAIVYPTTTARVRDTILAVPKELTKDNPTYPEYSSMGDQLAFAKIRLWDATGGYPMRTLRSGAARYKIWSQLIPQIEEV